MELVVCACIFKTEWSFWEMGKLKCSVTMLFNVQVKNRGVYFPGFIPVLIMAKKCPLFFHGGSRHEGSCFGFLNVVSYRFRQSNEAANA